MITLADLPPHDGELTIDSKGTLISFKTTSTFPTSSYRDRYHPDGCKQQVAYVVTSRFETAEDGRSVISNDSTQCYQGNDCTGYEKAPYQSNWIEAEVALAMHHKRLKEYLDSREFEDASGIPQDGAALSMSVGVARRDGV